MKAKAFFRILFAAALAAALIADTGPVARALPMPQKLFITPADKVLEKGDSLQLAVLPSPLTADPAVTWTSSDRRIARVDGTGRVTARKVGTVQIKAQSKARRAVYTLRTLKVVDTKTVTAVFIEVSDGVLVQGGTLALASRVLPVTASQAVAWSCDREDIATVSPAGVVSGWAPGVVTVTASAGSKRAQQRITVVTERPASDLPLQITSVALIDENLKKLDAILGSATSEVDALHTSGAIGKAEADVRKAILLNAFRMARFPWISGRTVKYWSGSSRYLSNVVYYGLPYTQRNRSYNVSKSLKSGAFRLLGGNAHYNAYLKDVYYPGNDCSAFVSMCIWGTGTSRSLLRTPEIKKSSGYRTVASSSNRLGYQKLRPGDILVKNGHVVMFLYYTNSFHTQMMVIQQGGRASLNTVGCAIKPLSYYSPGNGYIGRRKKPFA